jgi:hypothetical protein
MLLIKLLVRKVSGKFTLAFELALASLFLVACGSTPPPNLTASTNATPVTSSIGAGKGNVTQPKVVAQGRDAQGGNIEFTEPPVSGDGVPDFIMFETEN